MSNSKEMEGSQLHQAVWSDPYYKPVLWQQKTHFYTLRGPFSSSGRGRDWTRWCVRFSSSLNMSVSSPLHANDTPPGLPRWVSSNPHFNYGCHLCCKTGQESWAQLKLTVPEGVYHSLVLPQTTFTLQLHSPSNYLNISTILTKSPQTLKHFYFSNKRKKQTERFKTKKEKRGQTHLPIIFLFLPLESKDFFSLMNFLPHLDSGVLVNV